MIDVNRIVTTIGLDVDSKNLKYLEMVHKQAAVYGEIQTMATVHGAHYKIKLFKPVKLKESLWIRFSLHDDNLRLLFDCLRIITDVDNLDVLWDVKQKIKIKNFINKVEVLT